MKHNMIQDERVIGTKRNIQSAGFQIVWLVLLISALVQQYVYKAPFSQYAVEFFILIAMSVYILVANIVSGNDLFSEKRSGTLIVVASIVAGAAFSVISTVSNVMSYRDNIQHPLIIHIALVAGFTFVSCTTISFFIIKIFHTLNKKKQQAIDKKLNDDDINAD